jgi:hypothetical protein
MFIYFPEFIYRKTKEIVKNTFTNEITEKYAKKEITELFTSQEWNNKLNKIKKEKIALPILNLEHCFKPNLKSELEPFSNYDLINNQINICSNMCQNNFLQILKKEFSYFYLLNTEYAGKDLTINNLANLALVSCYESYNSEKISKNIKIELAKRCASIELKYKFKNELNSKTDDLNNLIQKLIEQNLNIIF